MPNYPKPPAPTDKQLQEREGILALAGVMAALPSEEQMVEDEVTSHYFAPGVYARVIVIPEGNVIVGKLHKTEHLNILCKGRCSVSTEDGPIVMEGPVIMNSRPGVQKAILALEETTWVTIHVTDETDLDKIEREVIAEDYDEIEYEGE